MNNSHCDLSKENRFTRYYGLQDFPEAMFLIETEFFENSTDMKTKTNSSPKGIVFVLGIFAVLLLVSFLELSVYRFLSKEVSDPNSQVSQSTLLEN